MSTAVLYRVDADDRITSVGGAWDDAATAGSALDLCGSGPLGRILWDFVRDRSLRDAYRALFERVRRGARPIRFEFRCDSPASRRTMEMELLPEPCGALLVSSRLLRDEPREEPLQVVAAFRGREVVVRCSVCGEFRVEGLWRDIVDAVTQTRLLGAPRPVQVAHGVCERCLARLETL